MPSIVLDAERRVGVDSARVRTVALDVLRRQKYQLTSEWASVLEAQRGSAVRSVMMPDAVPVSVRIDLTAETGSCRLAMRVTDRAVSVVMVGVQEPYRVAFEALLMEMDRALGELDPQAAPHFPAPRWWFRGNNVQAVEQGHAAGQRFVGNAVAAISGRLGGRPQRGAPAEWGGYDHVVFASTAGVAVLDMASVRALLTIPVMISVRPGALPQQLAAQAHEFAALVERRLSAGGRGGAQVDVPEEHVKTFEFLHQQFSIRSGLPLRTLCVCVDCRHPKVVNLDLQRLRQRNRNLKALVSLGSLYSGHSEPSPFKVFSTVFRQAKLEPDYVCGRCESTEANEQPVTFCPECGEMCSDSVLLKCAKCSYDYRSPVRGAVVWQPASLAQPPGAPPMPIRPPQPAMPPTPGPGAGFGPPPRPWLPAPAPAPAAAPRPQVACVFCGRSYPTLWRIQVAEPPGLRTLIVCATNPQCSPPSLVPPVPIRP